MTVNDVWDVYLNSHIVDTRGNYWVGPNAISLPLTSPIHIITAWNPHEVILSDQENFQRNMILNKELSALDIQYEAVIGCSPSGLWQEESFAIFGLSRTDACCIALKHNQRGIFELTDKDFLAIDAVNKVEQRRRSRVVK